MIPTEREAIRYDSASLPVHHCIIASIHRITASIHVSIASLHPSMYPSHHCIRTSIHRITASIHPSHHSIHACDDGPGRCSSVHAGHHRQSRPAHATSHRATTAAVSLGNDLKSKEARGVGGEVSRDKTKSGIQEKKKKNHPHLTIAEDELVALGRIATAGPPNRPSDARGRN